MVTKIHSAQNELLMSRNLRASFGGYGFSIDPDVRISKINSTIPCRLTLSRKDIKLSPIYQIPGESTGESSTLFAATQATQIVCQTSCYTGTFGRVCSPICEMRENPYLREAFLWNGSNGSITKRTIWKKEVRIGACIEA